MPPACVARISSRRARSFAEAVIISLCDAVKQYTLRGTGDPKPTREDILAQQENQPELYGFRAVYAFNISQTEGKDVPTLIEVHGDVSGYLERLARFVEAQGIALSYSTEGAPAKGFSHGGKITLLSGVQSAEEFSTLTHEICFEMLHRGDRRTREKLRLRQEGTCSPVRIS
jgi:hypothetical protein